MADEPTGRTPARYEETQRTTPWVTSAQWVTDFHTTRAETERLRIDRDRKEEEAAAATYAAVGYVETPHEILERRHRAAMYRAREALADAEEVFRTTDFGESSTRVRGIVTEARSDYLDRTRRTGFDFRNINANGVNPR